MFWIRKEIILVRERRIFSFINISSGKVQVENLPLMLAL
jgi:hypothetical protein